MIKTEIENNKQSNKKLLMLKVVLIDEKKRLTDGLDSYISNHCDFFPTNLSSSEDSNNKTTGFLGYTGTTRFYNEKQNEIDENYNKRKPAMSLVEPSKAIIDVYFKVFTL